MSIATTLFWSEVCAWSLFFIIIKPWKMSSRAWSSVWFTLFVTHFGVDLLGGFSRADLPMFPETIQYILFFFFFFFPLFAPFFFEVFFFWVPGISDKLRSGVETFFLELAPVWAVLIIGLFLWNLVAERLTGPISFDRQGLHHLSLIMMGSTLVIAFFFGTCITVSPDSQLTETLRRVFKNPWFRFTALGMMFGGLILSYV